MIELHGIKVRISFEGVQTVTRIYYVAGENEIGGIPRSVSGINGQRVELVGIEAVQAEEGRQFVVTGQYEGMANKDLTQKTYTWTPESSAEPIETNINFQTILREYGGYEVNKGSGEYVWPDIKPRRAKEAVKNPMAGVKSYLSLGGLWQESQIVEKIPGDVFKEMWQLVESVPGDLPTPAGRLWLVLPVSIEQRGACYVLTRQWKLTGEMDEAGCALAKMIYNPIGK